MTTEMTYRPIPVGELLEQLRADGFVITPDSYQRIFTVVDAFFPDGLPVEDNGRFSESFRHELSQLLGPVVTRNEAEQSRFANRFTQLLTESESTDKPKEPDVLVNTTEGHKTQAPASNWLIVQIGLLLLTGGWLIELIRSTLPETSKADILITTVDWQTRQAKLDSLTASRVDTVWWDFGDDTRFVIAQTGPVTHTYGKAGDYQISATWRNVAKRDSARIMTKIIDDDPCRLNFAVFSVGNSYTFVNQSPGLQSGFIYRLDFGDGTRPVVGKRPSVTHTYADDSRQYAVRLTTLAPGCPGTTVTQYIREAAFAPTFADLRRMPDRRLPQFVMLWWLPFVLIGSGATVAGLVLGGWFRRQHRPQPPNSDPPYELTFPDQQAGIRVGASMDDWAQQLQQRDEGSRRLLDVSKTVLATARRGGYPTVAYRRMKSRPHYVVLIDHRSAQHQQARVYSFLTTVLIESDVEVEPFCFHTDPRYCWNETYPQGLTLDGLYRLHAASNLVLITEGTRLIDYEERTLASWVFDGLGSWANRAILTPVYPENWNVIEAILSEFFVVLPATPDGQLLLRSYFQSETLPTFADLRQTFGVTGLPEGRGLFGKTPSTVTAAEVQAFLEKSFSTESLDADQQELLWQWACATAVYPMPNYDVTVAIGKAIENHTNTRDLVTTGNLLKLTALPHLKQSTIPDQLQDKLLAELRPDVEGIARQAVLMLLNDPDHQPPPGSRAETDRNLQRWMQWLQLDDPDKRQEALRELRPYQQAGYVTNRRAREVVERTGQQQRQRYSLVLTLLTVLLLIVAAIWPAQSPKTQVASSISWAYAELPARTDSAVYYNNRAVGRLDTARITYAVTVATQYEPALRELTQSLRHRVSAAALQNLHALRYDQALANRQTSVSRVRRLVQRTLSPMGEVPTLMAPIRLLDPVWVPTDSTLMQYLFQITTHAPAADVYSLLATEGKNEFNKQSASQSVVIGAGSDTTGFARLVVRAQQSYDIAHINMLVRQTKMAGPNVLRIRLSDTTAINPKSLDRLVPLEVARIQLYYGGPKNPTVIRPAPPVRPSSLALKKPRLSPIRRRMQSRLPKPSIMKQSASQGSPTVPAVRPDYSPISRNKTPGATSPVYSLTSIPVKWDNESIKNAPNDPVSRRGLTEPYGVLVGQLKEVKRGDEDGGIYLLVSAGDKLYRISLHLRGERQPVQQKQSSKTYSSNYSTIVSLVTDNQLTSLDAYQLFRESKEGFYPLERTPKSGALDYVRDVGLNEKQAIISGNTLLTRLQRTMSRLLQKGSKEQTSSGSRVLIWGTRWQPDTDTVFDLTNDFYEIHNVQLNQGSLGANARQNAPWQDGGLILINENSKEGPVAYLIQSDTQTLNVDDNGDPRYAPTAK